MPAKPKIKHEVEIVARPGYHFSNVDAPHIAEDLARIAQKHGFGDFENENLTTDIIAEEIVNNRSQYYSSRFFPSEKEAAFCYYRGIAGQLRTGLERRIIEVTSAGRKVVGTPIPMFFTTPIANSKHPNERGTALFDINNDAHLDSMLERAHSELKSWKTKYYFFLSIKKYRAKYATLLRMIDEVAA